jgi:hypothetical protein
VLCASIKEKGGRSRPNDRAGNLGWFHLRLTRLEVRDLFRAAEAEGLTEPLDKPSDVSGSDPWELDGWKMSVEWRLTPEGKKQTGLTGAGIRDTLRRVPGVARTAYAIAVILLGSTIGALVTAAGLKVADKSAAAYAFLIAGLWAFIGAVVFAGYTDEARLKKCARAWPRMRAPEYRRARFQAVDYAFRSPLAGAIFVFATVAAALGAASVLLHAQKPPDELPQGAWIAAGVVVAITCGLLCSSGWNARRNRRAYRAELDNRKSKFKASPDKDEGIGRRILRTAQLLLPRF